MNELNAKELHNLCTAGESKYVEYKASSDLSEKAEILRQLTAFANRAGGTLLYGVNDDGTIEGVSIDANSNIENISNLVQNKTSPTVDFTPLFYHGSDGDILALKVMKHKGIPCAVVNRKNHEIENRKYFIRINNGVRMMDDTTLEWLFKHQRDPIIDESFQTCIHYRREDMSFSTELNLLPMVPPFTLIQIFQSLNKEQIELLKMEEVNMALFLSELLPYAIIARLSNIYSKSWKIDIKRIGTRTNYHYSLQSSSEKIDLIQFSKLDQSTFLKKISFNLENIFKQNQTLCLPKGTSCNLKSPHGHGFVLFNKDAFDISIDVSPSMWGEGAAPGHPIRSIQEGLVRGNAQLELREIIAHVILIVNIRAHFVFPDIPSDEFFDYYNWAQQLIDEIKFHWDWDLFVNSLPKPIMYSIDRNVREILEHVKGTKVHDLPG